MKFLDMKKLETNLDFCVIDAIVGFRNLNSSVDLVSKNKLRRIYAWSIHGIATGHYVRGARLICMDSLELLLSVAETEYGQKIDAIWHQETILDEQRVRMLMDEPVLVKVYQLECNRSQKPYFDPWRVTEERWISF